VLGRELPATHPVQCSGEVLGHRFASSPLGDELGLLLGEPLSTRGEHWERHWRAGELPGPELEAAWEELGLELGSDTREELIRHQLHSGQHLEQSLGPHWVSTAGPALGAALGPALGGARSSTRDTTVQR
jgi:hypothetical protein